jgi:hypothetical protein
MVVGHHGIHDMSAIAPPDGQHRQFPIKHNVPFQDPGASRFGPRRNNPPQVFQLMGVIDTPLTLAIIPGRRRFTETRKAQLRGGGEVGERSHLAKGRNGKSPLVKKPLLDESILDELKNTCTGTDRRLSFKRQHKVGRDILPLVGDSREIPHEIGARRRILKGADHGSVGGAMGRSLGIGVPHGSPIA